MILTEDELCKTYGVSKATIRGAIAELVCDGYVRRQQGKGLFVICAESPPGFVNEDWNHRRYWGQRGYMQNRGNYLGGGDDTNSRRQKMFSIERHTIHMPENGCAIDLIA